VRRRGVLDELLGDRRPALHRPAARDVLPQRAGGAAQVDALVLVEALVLDRDDRVLHRGRDVLRRDDDPAEVGQRREVLAVHVGQQRVLRPLELRAVLELRQVGCDRHHHPEGRRDERQHRQAGQDERHPQALVAGTAQRRVRDDHDVGTFGDAHATKAGTAASLRRRTCGAVDDEQAAATPRARRTLALGP
jgi:hypothetical protein